MGTTKDKSVVEREIQSIKRTTKMVQVAILKTTFCDIVNGSQTEANKPIKEMVTTKSKFTPEKSFIDALNMFRKYFLDIYGSKDAFQNYQVIGLQFKREAYLSVRIKVAKQLKSKAIVETLSPWVPALDDGEYPGLLKLCEAAQKEALEFLDGRNVERNQLELALA